MGIQQICGFTDSSNGFHKIKEKAEIAEVKKWYYKLKWW